MNEKEFEWCPNVLKYWNEHWSHTPFCEICLKFCPEGGIGLLMWDGRDERHGSIGGGIEVCEDCENAPRSYERQRLVRIVRHFLIIPTWKRWKKEPSRDPRDFLDEALQNIHKLKFPEGKCD